MHSFSKKQKINLFSKIIILFLIVMTPIFMLGIYIRNWGGNTVRGELSKYSTAQIEFYLSQLEEEIERIKILQYACLNDESLNRLVLRHSIMSDYEIVSSLGQLQDRLITIANSSSYVRNVSAHIIPINKSISSLIGLDELTEETIERTGAVTKSGGAGIVRYKGGLYLTARLPYNASTPNYIIEIELNKKAFAEALKQFNIYNDSGSFLIDLTDSSEIAVASTGHLLLPEEILDDYNIDHKSSTNVGRSGDYRYYSVYAKSDYLDMLLIRYLPENLVFMPMRNSIIWMWVFNLVSLIAIIVFTVSMNRFINKPIKKLIEVFRQVENGNLEVSLDTADIKTSEFSYLYRRFNKMVESLNVLIDQAYKQKILTQRAELKQLQAQIKPHFLYNSFFTINTMAQLGDDNLIEFTNHLGEYYRYLTRNSTDNIPLYEEVEHARTYTSIQAVRFSKNLVVDFSPCPAEYAEKLVPRLILQPIIENAFEHAVGKKGKDRIIKISFETGNGSVYIIVEDNGAELTEERLSQMQTMLSIEAEGMEITALINIHRRLQLEYSDASGILIKRSNLGGLRVELVLECGREG